MSQLKQDLQAIRDVLAKGHCRGAIALDAHGNEVKAGAKEAVAWCLYGAEEKAGLWGTERVRAVDNHLHTHMPSEGTDPTVKELGLLSCYSDTHSQAEVLAWIDTAIAAV